ncbi:MAG: hypothetical protein J7647_05810 [Cyanobacteria bacterium SBLK]|nr:hypothetical protein [Cyanobacteria bacterium SBLK]
MPKNEFYLLTDSTITCSYLVSKWIESFSHDSNFRGILVKEEQPSIDILQKRKTFHANYVGQKQLTHTMKKELNSIYSDFDDTEKAMIDLFGISKSSTTGYTNTFFLGNNVNGKYAKNFLQAACKDVSPYIFVCVTQILKPWWIELSHSKIFNVHSAVLPYARGVYAIENMATLRDIDKFKQAAGFTIHYIDEGVDMGPIIRAERVIDPFRFNSIWSLKGYIYMAEFDAYIEMAKEILANEGTMPAGIIQNPSLRGPNFLGKNFTSDKRRDAEKSYVEMKSQIKNV